MKIVKKSRRGLILIFTILVALGLLGGVRAALAADPDVTVTYGDNGRVGNIEGSLFEDGFQWYPGASKQGIIRIINNGSGQINLTNINFELDNSLKNYFDLSWLPVGSDSVAGGRSGDILYTLTMKNTDDRSLQGATGTLTFTLHVEPTNTGGGGGGGGSNAHWAHDCVVACIDHDILSPEIDVNVGENFENLREKNYTIVNMKNHDIPDSDYLDGPITRGEVAVFLGRAFQLENKIVSEEYGNQIYKDYSFIPDFCKGYSISTYAAGIYKGYAIYDEKGNYTGREFCAKKPIPREEVSCVLFRAFDLPLSGDVHLTFIDAGQISFWAVQDIKPGIQNKIIVGFPDNTFRPKDPMTRAQFFALLCRLMGYHSEHNVRL